MLSGNGFNFLGGVTTKKGIPVTESSTLTLPAFFNAIDIISNDYAKLPKAIYQKTAEGRIKLDDHSLNYLLSIQPNPLMTAFMFHKMMLLHAILKGNGYAEIIRNNSGAAVQLNLVDQNIHTVEVFEYSNKLFYKFNGKTVPADDMLHVPSFSLNGITGIGIIQFAAHSLGVALSSREFATDYYNSKGLGFGVVTTSKDMNPTAKEKYGDAIGAALSNTGSGYKAAVIDEAASFTHLNITPQESMFLETNKAGVEMIAQFLNIPLHKLKVLDNMNNSITENLELGYVKDSVESWQIRFDNQYTVKLLTRNEVNAKTYIKSNLNALMRTDTKTRTDYYTKAIFSGYMTRNEVRKKEEMNTLPGLDDPLTPVNTQTTAQIEKKLKDE